MEMVAFVIILLWNCFSRATIDLNLAELQYLADHLHAEQCRRLVASLHFNSYNTPKALDIAEENVSKDIPCIRLLLHWNSEKGEGKGETHEVLQHRLRQLGHGDLADWLGKTVFHELGEELMENLNDPFRDVINVTEKETYKVLPTLTTRNRWGPTEWIAFDTVCWTLIIVLGIFAFVILTKAAMLLFIRRKRRISKQRNYKTLEDDSSESEDRFDITLHNKGTL